MAHSTRGSVGAACSIGVALLVAGCANISRNLTDSMEDAAKVSETCVALGETYNIDPRKLRDEVASVGEAALEIQSCEAGVAAAKCIDSLKDALVEASSASQVLLSRVPEDRKDAIASFDKRLRDIRNAALGLRAQLRAQAEGTESDVGKLCSTDTSCYIQLIRLFSGSISSLEATIFGLIADLEALKVEGQIIGSQAAGDLANFTATVNHLQDEVERRLRDGKATLTGPTFKAELKNLGLQLASLESGRLFVRAANGSTQAVDKLLDRVDDKTWFVATLGLAWYEPDIRKAFKNFFKSQFDHAGTKSEIAGIAVGAIAYASCEQLTGETDAKPTRGSYLTHPMFSGLVEAYGEWVPAEPPKSARGATKPNPSPPLTIKEALRSKIKEYDTARCGVAKAINPTRSSCGEGA